jgi:hypothetical protein
MRQFRKIPVKALPHLESELFQAQFLVTSVTVSSKREDLPMIFELPISSI